MQARTFASGSFQSSSKFIDVRFAVKIKAKPMPVLGVFNLIVNIQCIIKIIRRRFDNF
jgi:hypothetical protein